MTPKYKEKTLRYRFIKSQVKMYKVDKNKEILDILAQAPDSQLRTPDLPTTKKRRNN